MSSENTVFQEKILKPVSGYRMMALQVTLLLVSVVAFLLPAAGGLGIAVAVLNLLLLRGYVQIAPGEALLVMVWGEYRGTARENGLFWVHPLRKVVRLSLRMQSYSTKVLQLADAGGDPVQVAVSLHWRIADTARAAFQLAQFGAFVQSKTEAAMVALLAAYPLQHWEENSMSLHQHLPTMQSAVRKKLNQELQAAGLQVEWLRIVHLSYAPEIIKARWLQRQTQNGQQLAYARKLWEQIQQDAAFQQQPELQQKLFIRLMGEAEMS